MRSLKENGKKMCFSNSRNSLKWLRTKFMTLKPPNTQKTLGRSRNSAHSMPSQESNKGSQPSRSTRVQEIQDSCHSPMYVWEYFYSFQGADKIILFLLMPSSDSWPYRLRISCHEVQCKGTFVLHRKCYYCFGVSYRDCFLIAVSYCFATWMVN